MIHYRPIRNKTALRTAIRTEAENIVAQLDALDGYSGEILLNAIAEDNSIAASINRLVNLAEGSNG